MTTIRLSTQSVDIPVTFSSGDIGNLFDQSLTDMIAERVNAAILVSQPDETAVATTLENSTRFNRNIRNQVMESIDYHQIRCDVLEEMNYSEIVESVEGLFDEARFVVALTRNIRFKNMIENTMNSIVYSDTLTELVKKAVQERTANIENEIAEKVLAVIGNRLTGGMDV
jgi:hypothetical protein